MRSVALAVLAVLAVLAACTACGPRPSRPATNTVPWASSGVDWSRPPPVVGPTPWHAPAIHEHTLANGIRILVVENHRLPLVALSAIHARAGGREDGRMVGVAALTADVMDERTALDLTEIDTAVASDFAVQQLLVASPHVQIGIAELANKIRRPDVADDNIAAVRDLRARELTERRDRPRAIAAQVFDRVAFDGHPYGVPPEGLPETVAAIAPDAVRTFWKRAYRPDAMTIVVAGDVSPERARELVDGAFGDWKAVAAAADVAPKLPAYAPKLAYVDTPGAAEAIVLVGRRATAAGDARQLAADVASTIVGGGTDARLDRVLHGDLGYTFGASASFWRGKLAGSWTAAATFRDDVAGDAVRTMLALIETARTTEATPDELAAARTNMMRGRAASFETMASTVRAVERLVVLGLPLDWYATISTRLDALTAADVRAAVEDAWRDLSIVVVGDWTRLGDALRGIGLPVVAYTRDGSRVP